MTFAERLAREGHDLVLVARRRDRLEDLAQRLRRDTGAQADVMCADLTDPQALGEIEARAASDDALTLLINNAGFAGYQPFTTIDPKVINDLIEVHIRAVARLSGAALPGMIRRGRGAIINIASLLALTGTLPPSPLPHRATYAGAKAFMLAFTQALAGEWPAQASAPRAACRGGSAPSSTSCMGLVTSKLPPAMTAEDVVTASLAALAREEVVCIPRPCRPHAACGAGRNAGQGVSRRRHAAHASRNAIAEPPASFAASVHRAAILRERARKLVLPEWIEHSTSPLPRGCSTTELRQHLEASAYPIVAATVER